MGTKTVGQAFILNTEIMTHIKANHTGPDMTVTALSDYIDNYLTEKGIEIAKEAQVEHIEIQVWPESTIGYNLRVVTLSEC